MEIQLNTLPFSYNKSYFVFSNLEKRFVLRDIHGGDMSPSDLFAIVVEGHEDLYEKEFQKNYHVMTSETSLVIENKQTKGFLRIVFSDAETILFENKDLSYELKALKERYDTVFPLEEDLYEFISYKKDQHYHLKKWGGTWKLEAPFFKIGNTQITLKMPKNCQFTITGGKIIPKNLRKIASFEECEKKNRSELTAFRHRFAISNQENSSFQLATYLLWVNEVKKEGQLKENAIYMSKNWMQNIWSWDNCFASLALSKNAPELAYDQLKIFFDHQDETGAFPDFVNDSVVSYSCVKPPIHAWTFEMMRQKNPLLNHYLKETYEGLKKNTLFWLKYRRHPKTRRLYYSHGNDSGWDNSTVFHDAMPISSPDLLAFLIKQCQVLEKWSQELNLANTSWKKEKEALLEELLKDYYDEKRQQFVAINAFTNEEVPYDDSLILRMPVVILPLLPIEIQKALVKDLTVNFETNYGLSTEKASSSFYEDAGYWRGPIWAPASYLFIKGLEEGGFIKESRRLKEKFIKLVEIGGMAENYDAKKATGNDDLGFTWSSAVTLLFLEDLEAD